MNLFALDRIPYVPLVFAFALLFVCANWRWRKRR